MSRCNMTIFSLFLLSSTVFALTIDPVSNVVQCQVSLFTWNDGVPPYNLSIYPAYNPNDTPLVNLGTESGTSCMWTANLSVGVDAILEVTDAKGDSAESSSFTVQVGSDNNCLRAADSTTSASAGAISGPTSPASGSDHTSSASVTAGSNINVSQNTSSTSTGAAASPSTAAAAFHYTPVGTLAMTGVASLAIALVL